MDSITQAVLGASVAEAVAGKKIGRAAPIAGALIATIPDLDIILTPFLDTYQRIGIHRGYSHSLVFCIGLSIILAFLLKRTKWYSRLTLSRIYLLAFLCLFTHVLLDSFTTYGTQLWLPFNTWRVSLDSITIVDPVYTIPLLGGLLISVLWLNKKPGYRPYPNAIGLIVSSIYLVFTLSNKERIEGIFHDQLQTQSLNYNRLLTVPVKIANLEWYGVARNDKQLYLGKYSVLDKNKILFDSFPINEALLASLDEDLAERMRWFSKDFYTVAEKDGTIRVYNMQCDMQGVRKFGEYKAPTAFYYEITPGKNGHYILDSGMHEKNKIEDLN